MKTLTTLRSAAAAMILCSMISCTKEDVMPTTMQQESMNTGISKSVEDHGALDFTPRNNQAISAGNYESLIIEVNNATAAGTPELRIELRQDLQVFYDGSRAINLGSGQFRINPDVYNDIMFMINKGILDNNVQDLRPDRNVAIHVSKAELRNRTDKGATIVCNRGQGRIDRFVLDNRSANDILEALNSGSLSGRVFDTMHR